MSTIFLPEIFLQSQNNTIISLSIFDLVRTLGSLFFDFLIWEKREYLHNTDFLMFSIFCFNSVRSRRRGLKMFTKFLY